MLMRTCCCGISLRTGTIVVASFSIIGAIVNVIGMGVHLSEVEHDPELHRLFKGYSILSIVQTLIIGWLTYNLLLGIFAGLVIVGTIKKSPVCLFPWIAMSFSGMSVLICATLALVVICIMTGSAVVIFALLLFIGINLSLHIFLWLIVYSHYQQLVADKFGELRRPLNGEILKAPEKSPPYYIFQG